MAVETPSAMAAKAVRIPEGSRPSEGAFRVRFQTFTGPRLAMVGSNGFEASFGGWSCEHPLEGRGDQNDGSESFIM